MDILPFFSALSEAGVSPGDDILLHTSFKAIKKLLRVNPTTLSESEMVANHFLLALAERHVNANILMPTEYVSDYQMQSMKREVLSASSPSNRGFLTNVFLTFSDEVKRSLHPIYNLAVLGNDYDKEIEAHHQRAFSMSEGSPWHSFTKRSGKIVFIGVGVHSNSLIHLPEYELGLDYPRPVFLNQPHEFRVKHGSDVVDVKGYIHGIQWGSDTVEKFVNYMDGKYNHVTNQVVNDISVIVMDAEKQWQGLHKELEAGLSWYDAFAW